MHHDERKTDEVTYPPDDCGFCPRHKGVRVDLHLVESATLLHLQCTPLFNRVL